MPAPHASLPLAGPPATPDADEARRAAEEELSRAVYHQRQGLWERFWRWLLKALEGDSPVLGMPWWVSYAVVALALVLLVLALVVILRRVTLPRRSAQQDQALFGDDRDSADLARAADSASARGDHATALIERFRAIIRSLDEQGIIEEYPGMTAAESVALATRALGHGEIVTRLAHGAELFDAVRYGRVTASPQQDEWMRRLAQDTARIPRASRPGQPEPQAAGAPA